MAGAEITDQYRQPGPYRTLPTPVILFVAQQKGPLRHTLRPVFAEAMASRSDHLLPGHQPDRPFNRCRHSAMPMMRHHRMHEHRRTGHQHGYESDMSTQRHESRGKRNTTKIMLFVFVIVLVLFLPLFPKATQRYAKAGFGSDKPTSRTQNPTLRAAASGLCGENPSFRVPSGTSRRRGWRRLARPVGSQFPNRLTKPQASDPSKTTSSHPFPRPTILDRAPGEILPFQLIVETDYFPFKAGARELSAFSHRNPTKGGRPQGFHLDCALAQRVKSLFRRAGDRYRS